MTGTIKRTTTNYSLRVPIFDAPGWGREVERNFDIIDSVMFAISAFTNVKGVWTNGTDYSIGERLVDPAANQIFVVDVNHTSASTGTFAEDRAAHPTYWSPVSSTSANRGAWTTNTKYNTNDYVTDVYRVGIVVQPYTSGASYNADVAAENIVTLVDLTTQVTNAYTYSQQALASKNAAATSETNAATSAATATAKATAAANSATAAATSETNAGTSATTATTKAAAASTSATNAATSAANSLTYSNNSSNSAGAADTSADEAAASAALAQKWASNPKNVVVSGGAYSALHYATIAAEVTVGTAGTILDLIKTVDGVGSGLDADLLDGQQGAYYLSRANQTGVIPDAGLPAGLKTIATFLADANNANSDGIFGATDTTINTPSPGFWLIEVSAGNNVYLVQTAYPYSSNATDGDTQAWRRTCVNGVWSAWYRLRISQTEQQGMWDQREGFLYGLTLSQPGDTLKITMAAGVAFNTNNTIRMVLPAAITKSLSSTFVAGNNNGGFAAGESVPGAGGTIHFWLIVKADGTADVLISNHASSGLFPTLPTGFIAKRRIGSVRTVAGNTASAFLQVGDHFTLKSPVADVAGAAQSLTPTNRVISVPVGAKHIAKIVATPDASDNSNFFVYDPDLGSIQASSTARSVFVPSAPVTVGVDVRTDIAGQVRMSSSGTSATVTVVTLGWIDSRERQG